MRVIQTQMFGLDNFGTKRKEEGKKQRAKATKPQTACDWLLASCLFAVVLFAGHEQSDAPRFSARCIWSLLWPLVCCWVALLIGQGSSGG